METTNTSMQAQALATHGYLQVSHDGYLDLPNQILLEAWQEFCAQHLKHKQKFLFTQNGGYEYKTKVDHGENKENFHITMGYNPLDVPVTSTDIHLFDAAKYLIDRSAVYILDVARIFQWSSSFDVVDMVEKAKNNWQLRLLHYHPDENYQGGDSIVAEPHVDKGITIHLFEDAPGLEVLWGTKWQKVHPMAKHIVTYSGMSGQYYSESRFPALAHRVRVSQEVIRHGRNSIVLFLDFGDVVYDKARFGPLRHRFSNGENYHMLHEEFSKFFTTLENAVL